jgi:LuxR family maltose regulon positive regulatory protein
MPPIHHALDIKVKIVEQLLTTKLYMPQPRPELVRRPRLHQQLNEAPHRKLTLISAPAGFGKTTLVSDWTHSLLAEQSETNENTYRIAWFSLDQGDNDPARFLGYLVAALRRIEEAENPIGVSALTMLQSPQPLPVEDMLITLINDMSTISNRAILVLDDYHVIESAQIDGAITFLLEHLPPHMHIVIATRDDPRLPLARLRGRGQLTELRATDLRFTPNEAAEFLNQVMHLDLSSEDVAVLESRTEGWIAGLQLAAISMRGHHDTASFIQSFSGSHRFVLDYLIEEVLEQQSPDIQAFLLQTAILDRLTGPLCDALTGATDGHAMLETLERANLFVVPLDVERRWYRYHHLFADLLLQRLRQTQPDWELDLHFRACIWFEQQGFMDEAIEHALCAEDFDRAVSLMQHVAEDVWNRDEREKLRRWLDKLPEGLLFNNPQLNIFHAWSLFAAGQHDMAERSLQAIEQAVTGSSELSAAEIDQLHGRIAVARAHLAVSQSNVPRVIEYAHQALDYLTEQDVIWNTSVTIALGDAYSLGGKLTEAYHARVATVAASEATGNVYMILMANLKLAITLRQLGEIQPIIEKRQPLLQLANETGMAHTVTMGCLMAVFGEALAEKNDLDEALHLATTGVALVEHGSSVVSQGWAYLCLVRILFSRGEMDAAEEIIRKFEKADREADVPAWLTSNIATWRVRIWLAQGKLQAATQWAAERGLDLDVCPIYMRVLEYVAWARVLLAEGRLDEVLHLLERLAEDAEAWHISARLIEIMMLQALAYQAKDDKDQAMTALENALTRAEPGGFIRTFVDEGPSMAQLLLEAVARDIMPEYAQRLLAAFPASEPSQADAVSDRTPETELIEPLSEREIEVLHLIAEGLTNQEVASRLFLSSNTIKVHARNIYDKLGVNNRTQAVARARALGILSAD